jgi:DNA helicase-2/ATP-dependent DNA helicase PcrA
MKLNEPQRMAVESCVENNVVVIAGAGSGKTRVLTHAAAHLVKSGVDPRHILLLTFTNRAAGEMRDRASAMIGGKESTIWASTFHSFGARVLRKSGAWVGLDSDYSIIDANDAHSILVSARNHLYPSKEVQKGLPPIADITDMISAACSLVVPLPKYVEGLKNLAPSAREATVAIYKLYEQHKRKCNQLDFDDLLFYLFRLLGEKEPRQQLRNRFKHILVDEYQDTNHIQARILYRLLGKHNHFMVVGDDAQTIYTWRYARHTNLFEIAERYEGSKLIKMEQNYRSTQSILNLANAFQDQMEKQFQKVLWTEQAGGRKPEVRKYDDERAEAQAILQEIRTHQSNGMPLEQIAVLYRTNRCPTYLEFELLRAKIRYQKFGGRNFNEAAHIKDICAHLRAITNPKDAQAMFRALKLCDKVGIITAQKIIDQPGTKLTERIFSYSDAPNTTLQQLRELLGTLEYTKDPAKAVERVVNYYLKLPVVTRAQKNQTKTAAQQFRIETDCQALVSIASSYKTIRQLVNDLTLNTDSDKKKEKEDTLTLSTVHSAKGLEWPVVFVIQAFDGRLPKTNQEGEGDIEEELRVAYVAVTRPHRKLVITYPATIKYYRDRVPTRMSRFLEAADSDLYELQDKTDPYRYQREQQQRQYQRRRFRW